MKKTSTKKLNTEIFIQRAKEKHGDKYDYSKIEYKNIRAKVCIICPVHGEFWQKADSHINKCGCPDCSGNYKRTTEGFVEKAKLIHENKYNYSKVEYANAKTKVCIICPVHGEFLQIPNTHLGNHGCPICSGNKRLTTKEFIKKAKLIHKNKYDYLKINYTNNLTKVCIICPEHGEFWQKPNAHLSNHGCPICNESKGENLIRKFLLKENVLFKKQKTFKNCRNKRLLPFDFYLPEYNLLIEYDGEQHFVGWGHNKKNLKIVQKHDEIKTQYAKNNNIDLLRIPYTDFNNIDNILEKVTNVKNVGIL